jgi:hypothetical protein
VTFPALTDSKTVEPSPASIDIAQWNGAIRNLAAVAGTIEPIIEMAHD